MAKNIAVQINELRETIKNLNAEIKMARLNIFVGMITHLEMLFLQLIQKQGISL